MLLESGVTPRFGQGFTVIVVDNIEKAGKSCFCLDNRHSTLTSSFQRALYAYLFAIHFRDRHRLKCKVTEL